jgi:hypothetical protein
LQSGRPFTSQENEERIPSVCIMQQIGELCYELKRACRDSLILYPTAFFSFISGSLAIGMEAGRSILEILSLMSVMSKALQIFEH